MASFLWLFLIPTALVGIGYLTSWLLGYRSITIGEAAAIWFVSGLMLLLILVVNSHMNRYDTEILSGQVTGKESVRVSCSHSYSCRCRTVTTGAGKNRSSRRVCDTCYEHFYDMDWMVRTTVGSIEISRVDRQGTTEPPRFTAVLLGEPVARTSSFTNYIKGAESSLFRASISKEQLAKLQAIVPEYPRVFDYYRVNRAIDAGAGLPAVTAEAWNRLLAQELIKLGPSKQVNLVVIFTKRSQEYADAVERVWIGGKKNDVVVLYGVDDKLNPVWVRAFTYARSSGNEMTTVLLRDNLQAAGPVTSADVHVAKLVETVKEAYVRKPMSDFEYLASESEPSANAIFWIVLIVVLITIGGLIVAHKMDFSGNNRNFYR